MAYNEKLIVVIKSKGKVLREFPNNEVFIPFGSDYNILIKNKELSRKALVSIKVDGDDVLDGHSLVIEPSSEIELEGALKDGFVRNNFRFIERTKEVSNYRGVNPEDGLIEVSYRFEQRTQRSNFRARNKFNFRDDYLYPNITSNFNSATDIKYCCNNPSNSFNEEGITVPGKETFQNFTYADIGNLECITHNIIIKLKGKSNSGVKGKKRIKTPVSTRSKVQCQSCGRRWRSNLKFCGNCGTYLV